MNAAQESLDPDAITLERARDEEHATGLSLPGYQLMVGFIVLGTAGHIWMHYAVHGIFNMHQIAIAFFLVINLMVNFWEIGLLVCADRIKAEYEATKDKFKGNESARINEIMHKRVPLLKILSFKEWTGIWSGYALFDQSYVHKDGFGFHIDVGNGWSTPIFATLFAFGMTFPIMPARVLGIIGVIMFWQMFYGTAVYFFQFFYAGRHKGHSAGTIALMIGSSNGLWFIFPVWGMILSISMIMSDSYAYFL